MFILITKKEKIRLKPESLSQEYKKNLRKAIYDTFLFKAISENEIIVAIKEVVLFDGYVEQVTGDVQFQIELTYLVQQILQDEVYEGTIISQSKKGMFVKFGQLSVFIGKHLLQPNSILMKAKNEWVWQNDEDDPSSVLFYETSAKVKFRICAINFMAKLDELHPEEQTQIVGTMNGEGLGLVSWWKTE